MKINLSILLLFVISLRSAMAATLEDYLAASPGQKIEIFKNKPDRYLGNPKDLLRLHTAGLNDPSGDVRKMAARSSAFLMMGLQAAKKRGQDAGISH